jgi:adenylate cyclase
MSGDPEQDYFADGMVEEIISALSRIRWLFVIARNSSFTYKGQSVDVKRVGRDLGVRYVLEGSVRKAGAQVRITAQLIEAATGAHLWADRFDGSLDDVFALQDKVALSIAGVIEPTLQAAEIRYSAERPLNDLTAYDLYLRARSAASSYGREHLAQALDLLAQAIAREPAYGSALALAATYRVDLENYDWADVREEEQNRRAAIDLARAALSVAADDPGVLGRAAMVLGRFGEDIDAALALIDRALALNPSFAFGWHWSGWLRLFAGQADLAIQHFETSMRLDPRSKRGFHLAGIGLAHFVNRRFEDALAALRVSLEEFPAFTPTHRTLAACYAHMGRLDEAREIIKRLVSLTPVVVPSANPLRNPEHSELFFSGLRLAGGEASP